MRLVNEPGYALRLGRRRLGPWRGALAASLRAKTYALRLALLAQGQNLRPSTRVARSGAKPTPFDSRCSLRAIFRFAKNGCPGWDRTSFEFFRTVVESLSYGRSNSGAARSYAPEFPAVEEIADAWPQVSAEIRSAILTLVRSAKGGVK